MAGRIEFTPDADDYYRAQRTWAVRYLRSGRHWRRVGILLVIGAWVVWGVMSQVERDQRVAAIVSVAAVIGGIVGVLIANAIGLLLLRRRSARLFAQQRTLHQPWRYDWNDEGDHWLSPTTEMRVAWRDYVAWTESPTGFLLYLNDMLYHFLPRRAFTDQQAADLSATLIAHGPPRR
ncbi:YcxB family protein [Sphingomonas sp. DT-204]|uniref:YcxB family protein n=1 Tax=Sphingomonas sp. DT-204 TaxID=3396166 RepID=UPI003F1E24B1